MRTFQAISFAMILNLLAVAGQCQSQDKADQKRSPQGSQENTFVLRSFLPVTPKYRGNGISYGPFRVGQRPGGEGPTIEQIREDLKILTGDGWQMIRTYGTEPFAEKVCQVISDDKLPIKLMLGAWLATEKDNPTQKKENQGQVERAIKLANQYPDVVVAVSVANESQVSWSFHKVEQATLIRYVRQVRKSIKQPVTVADDFKYWRTDESKKLAAELDFIVTHAYAMWLGQKLENAVDWTKQRLAEVKSNHPNKLVVIGETGWATQKANHGEQAKLIKGTPGEEQQKEFFDALTTWLQKDRIPYFYFEAFDEPWKGGDDPVEVEKHWGIFKVDRTRKPAARPITK